MSYEENDKSEVPTETPPSEAVGSGQVAGSEGADVAPESAENAPASETAEQSAESAEPAPEQSADQETV